MVTNAMLRQAAQEAENALLQSLENQTYEPHLFSTRFQKKIGKLIRRAKHPIRYHAIRAVAAILLLIVTAFCVVFAASPDVRADVINWFKSTFMRYSEYSSDGQNNHAEYEYFFKAVPSNYSELNEIDMKDGKTYFYVNKDGSLLQFTYARGGRANNFFVKTDLHTHIEGVVNGNKADIYIATSDEESSAIIWIDVETETLLYINAKVSRDLLIELAETVIKAPKQ